ncbi:hypothetical protein ASF84_20150 [Pseudomonas sp. Leaf127]|uniref:hypothetical protein n=1 Tax=Pseudomonas sp. Leaf127 TaxID=1736267 RepID=UPI000702BB75|nr:hypothetical protein [Pseudomonas sp. Leaf127]KQQ54103.1 hypothetical protein ASF84_20150 [Pseudomonas sp. Leaf127]
MPTPRHAIENYILGKDGNRPDLLRQAFTPEARVEMVVRTDAISFPAHLEDRAAIAETLVRRFNQTYENIYTFCVGEPPVADAPAHTCKWFVGMSDKQTGEVRVGCGEYHWQFDPRSEHVTHLTIQIETMQVIPAAELAPVMDWLQGLSYPWCPATQATRQAPPLPALAAVIEYLQPPTPPR